MYDEDDEFEDNGNAEDDLIMSLSEQSIEEILDETENRRKYYLATGKLFENVG